MTSPRRWPLRATTSSRSRPPACATAWAGTPSARAASCSTCAASTRSCSTRARDRSRCSRARPGTTSRTCCIRALRSAPCSRPTSSRVGGSISVNAHGMDHQAGALAKSIKSMKVMLADGSLQTVSATENKDLFNLVVGGYGLFGVIVEAELDIADNLVYQTGRRMMDYKEFPALFARRDREGQQYRPDVRPPLDRAEHVPEGIAALYLHQGRRHRFQARAARRGLAAPNCGGSPSICPSRARCSRK